MPLEVEFVLTSNINLNTAFFSKTKKTFQISKFFSLKIVKSILILLSVKMNSLTLDDGKYMKTLNTYC